MRLLVFAAFFALSTLPTLAVGEDCDDKCGTAFKACDAANCSPARKECIAKCTDPKDLRCRINCLSDSTSCLKPCNEALTTCVAACKQ